MKQQPSTNNPNTIKIRLWGDPSTSLRTGPAHVAQAALKLRDCFVVVSESGDVRDRRGWKRSETMSRWGE